MKTLIVGDTHLKQSAILSGARKVIEAQGITQVVLLGDYFDEWNQSFNDLRYAEEADELVAFRNWCVERGIRAVFLLGNHDVPYLTGRLQHYSNRHYETVAKVADTLTELNCQVAYWLDEKWLCSHAGYTKDYLVEPWHLLTIAENLAADEAAFDENLVNLESYSGKARSGYYPTGGPLWADYGKELLKSHNNLYPHQVVGHSPQHDSVIAWGNLIAADTFSLWSNGDPIGKGEFLVYDDETGEFTPALPDGATGFWWAR